MSAYKTVQHYITHSGRRFHFVSYEAIDEDLRKGQEAMPATWYLMAAGKRWPAMDQQPDLDEATEVAQLTEWLEKTMFAKPGS